MDTYERLLAAVTTRGAKFAALGTNETTEDYLRRLVAAVGEVNLGVFEALPSAAKHWYDAAADALQAALPVPMPDGFDRASPRLGGALTRDDSVSCGTSTEAAPVGRGEDARTPERIMRPSGSAVPARHIVPNALPPPPPPRDEPASTQVIHLVLADEGASLDTIVQRLRERQVGTARSHIASLRILVLTTLRLAREAGWQSP